MITDDDKKKFIEKYADDDSKVPADERETYRKYVEEGVKKDWPEALRAKGYGCYGGSNIFPEDWVQSRDCLQRLVELTDDPWAYNSLGYIYYYGRCNNKVPEYEKAFQCFCIGSASGISESQYKMADMLLEGKGCIQSKIAGARMILSIYAENRMNFCTRHYDCKFADVALRVGGLFERGDGLDMDLEMAYTYYLEARCAIRRRRMHFDHFGDAKVEARIEESLARVKAQLPKEYFENDDVYDRPVAIGALLRNSDGMDITLSSKGAYYCITGKAYESTEVSGCTLLVLPRRDFSELVCAVTMRLSPDAKVDKVDLPYQAFISDISGIEGERLVKFQYRNMSMLEVECDYFLVEGCTVVED